MATQWEYRTVGVHYGQVVQADAPPDFVAWLDQLNRLGAEGWEVIGPITTYTHGGNVVELLLKRPYA